MSSDRIDNSTADLLNAARAVQHAAGHPRSSEAATTALASLEESLQALSAAWYQIAADAVPGIAGRERGRTGSPASADSTGRHLSREQEVRLIGTLHDVAGAFARSARTCRAARHTVAPLIDGVVSAGHPEVRFTDPDSHEQPSGLAA